MTDLQVWPRCNVPVSDGADGGEPCNESCVSQRVRACHDHARLCERCGENPRHPNKILCPWCEDAQRAEDSKPKSNDS